MIRDMEELLCADWTGGNGILEKTGGKLAERLINDRMPFILLHVEEDGDISFDGITEYGSSGLILNMSNRTGTVTDEMKKLELDDVFYHGNFGADGYFVYLKENAGKTLYQQIGEAVDLSGYCCCLCAGKSVAEVMELPAGSYLMMECSEIMRKMKGIAQQANSYKEYKQKV